MLEEAFEAQVFIQVLPVDAIGRERVLFALAGRGITQSGVVGKALAGLATVGRLNPNLGRREPNLRNFHHRLLHHMHVDWLVVVGVEHESESEKCK